MAKGTTEGSGAEASKSPEKPAAAETAAKAPAAAVATVVEELPRTIVRRVVKDKLSELAASSSSRKGKNSKDEEGEGEEMSVQKDALLAFAESARIFIHYLSAT